MTLLDHALDLANAGCCVIPARADGTKAPATDWKAYQHQRPTEDELTDWFTGTRYDGLGIVTGAISGNLEMLEIEGRATHLIHELAQLYEDHDLGELWKRIRTGYVVRTPTGGVHWHYRTADAPPLGNTKLARRPSTADELAANPKTRIQVLLETRGEGGFTVTAPSNGRTHPSGKPWVLIAGSPATIPTITAEERDALHAIARLLDQMPEPEALDPQPRRPSATVAHEHREGRLRPGDDYNQRATWDEVLTPHGWARVAGHGQATTWRRPGKTIGISATTGRNDGDNLYVFSTSTEFDPEKPYSKFAAYTLLEHGGDYQTAAKTLQAAGYGVDDQEHAQHWRDRAIPDDIATSSHNEATPDRPPDRRIVLTAASTIRPRRVHWCWDGRIALGTLSLLAGPEGLGKSTMAYWIAARITRGQLPGEDHGTSRAALVCATEDSWEHTIVPRLMAADADLNIVYRIEVKTADDITLGLSLPRDLHDLDQAARQTGAALLILDPLMSRISEALDSHKDGDVRRALEPMVGIADHTAMAIIGLIHHNKSGSSDPLSLVMASKAFTAVARSVHTVIKDPEDETETRRFFGTPKNNLGRIDLPVLSFTITGWSYDTDEGTGNTGQLQWGDDVDGTIGDAIRRATEDPNVRTAVTEARDWLDDYMHANGPQVSSNDIKRAAERAGHAIATVHRARRKLGLQVEFHGFPRESYWVVSRARAGGDATTDTTDTTRQSGQGIDGDIPLTIPIAQNGQSYQSSQSYEPPAPTRETTNPVGAGDTTCPRCSWPTNTQAHAINCGA